MDLCLIYSDFNNYKQVFNFHPIQDLKGLEGLTHLSLGIIQYPNFTHQYFKETILTDIDINLPKLKYLKIDCPFNASEWTAQLLTRLSNLQTIELKIENNSMIDIIKRQLIQNCKKFKKFIDNNDYSDYDSYFESDYE